VQVSAGAQTAQQPLTISVFPANAISVWSNETVPTAFNGADAPVELGVKFRSDIAGAITGIRFYKNAGNTGTHVANLWTLGGQLLASAVFVSETPSGWQEVSFATPVEIAANTVYVASYHCPNGFYARDLSFFDGQGVDAPPLRLLQDGEAGPNSVFAYGATSVFPTQTFLSTNYWVDVVFNANVGECNNGIDDDGDGRRDYPIDPGCASLGDLSERDPFIACDDGADNDGDGRADYDPVTFANRLAGLGDLGCGDPTGREDAACQDGIENDGDGLRDFDGGQSVFGACTGVPGGCPPGVSDPDGDGVANPDPQCAGYPYRHSERTPTCGLGMEMVLLLPALRAWRRRAGRREG
jgi:hypothetical protein